MTENWESEARFKPQALFGFLWTQKAPDPPPSSRQSVVITDHDSRTALVSKAGPEAHTVCFAPSPIFPKTLQDKAEEENAAEETDVRAPAAFQWQVWRSDGAIKFWRH